MKKRLTAAEVASLRPDKKVIKRYDGNGLILRIMPSGSKQWIWQGTVRGKRKVYGLGGYPSVTLRQARDEAYEYKKIARSGGDPRPERRQKNILTFEEAAERVITLHAPTWKSPQQARIWRQSLRDYTFPHIGKMPVDAVSGEDLMNCFIPHWETKKETMTRTLQRVSVILKWAIAQNIRADNPAEAIKAVLPRTNGKPENHPAVPYAEVGAAIETIRQTGAWTGTKLAFEFLVLTAARSGEVRLAEWREIDIQKAVWTIPAERMKAGKEHKVPLSKRAIEVLTEARKFQGNGKLVFPSVKGKELSDSTISKLMRENGIKSDTVDPDSGERKNAVPHGFRSSFRNWCAEQSIPREVAEACLAHVVKGVEGAYFRSDLFDLRHGVMADWSAFVG